MLSAMPLPKPRFALWLASIGAISVLLAASAAEACSCTIPTHESRFATASVVFEGVVGSSANTIVNVRSLRVWKGTAPTEIYEYAHGHGCRSYESPREGRRYIFYGTSWNLCALAAEEGTVRYGQLLAILGPPLPPQSLPQMPAPTSSQLLPQWVDPRQTAEERGDDCSIGLGATRHFPSPFLLVVGALWWRRRG